MIGSSIDILSFQKSMKKKMGAWKRTYTYH